MVFYDSLQVPEGSQTKCRASQLTHQPTPWTFPTHVLEFLVLLLAAQAVFLLLHACKLTHSQGKSTILMVFTGKDGDFCGRTVSFREGTAPRSFHANPCFRPQGGNCGCGLRCGDFSVLSKSLRTWIPKMMFFEGYLPSTNLLFWVSIFNFRRYMHWEC